VAPFPAGRVSPQVEITAASVRVGSRTVPLAEVRSLRERYGRWSGRAWLALGPVGARVPFGPSYGAHRARLRALIGDRRFESDWMDGRFPGLPGGLPPDLALALATGLFALIALAAASTFGAVVGLGIALLAAWPLGRLRDGWVVRPEGIRGGPPWAALVPWYDVASIHVRIGRRRALIWTRGRGGGHSASLPLVLLPALRARVRRLGGLDLIEGEPGLDDRYLRWRAPALGMPWGLGAGTLLAAPFTETPWTFVVAGAAAMAATALLGAMVTLRAGGWGSGGVLAGTLLYALFLAIAAVVGAGWIGGS